MLLSKLNKENERPLKKGPDIIKVRKEFNLNESIVLPEKIVHRKVNNKHLFIAPDKASYIVTDDTGKLLVEYFKNGLSIKDILNKAAATQSEAVRYLRDFLVNVEKNGFLEGNELKEDEPFSPVLQLYITNNCNIRCVHCYMDAGMKKNNEICTTDWVKVIDDYSNLYKDGKIVFTGGEPLLHTDFFKLIRRAKENGLKVEVFSNGTLINDDNAIPLVDYCDILQLSLDGVTPEINDMIRGEGVFTKVCRAINILEKSDLKIRIAMILMPQNADDLKENIDEFVKHFSSDLEFKIGFASIGGRSKDRYRFKTKYLGEKALQDILRKMYKKRLKSMRKSEPNMKYSNCGYGDTIAISSDGHIYGCAILYNSYGHVRDDNLGDIIKRIKKDQIDSNVENIEECSDCDIRFYCFGGCRLNNIIHHKSLFKSACTQKKKDDIYESMVGRREFDALSIWLGIENNG